MNENCFVPLLEHLPRDWTRPVSGNQEALSVLMLLLMLQTRATHYFPFLFNIFTNKFSTRWQGVPQSYEHFFGEVEVHKEIPKKKKENE